MGIDHLRDACVNVSARMSAVMDHRTQMFSHLPFYDHAIGFASRLHVTVDNSFRILVQTALLQRMLVADCRRSWIVREVIETAMPWGSPHPFPALHTDGLGDVQGNPDERRRCRCQCRVRYREACRPRPRRAHGSLSGPRLPSNWNSNQYHSGHFGGSGERARSARTSPRMVHLGDALGCKALAVDGDGSGRRPEEGGGSASAYSTSISIAGRPRSESPGRKHIGAAIDRKFADGEMERIVGVLDTGATG